MLYFYSIYGATFAAPNVPPATADKRAGLNLCGAMPTKMLFASFQLSLPQAKGSSRKCGKAILIADRNGNPQLPMKNMKVVTKRNAPAAYTKLFGACKVSLTIIADGNTNMVVHVMQL